MARSLPQPFHQILKRERRKHGWTQSTLAELLGIDANTVSRWERGSHVPFPIFRTKLSELFGIPLEELGLLDEEPEGIAPLLLSYAQADELFATRLKQDLESRELRLPAELHLADRSRGPQSGRTGWMSRLCPVDCRAPAAGCAAASANSGAGSRSDRRAPASLRAGSRCLAHAAADPATALLPGCGHPGALANV